MENFKFPCSSQTTDGLLGSVPLGLLERERGGGEGRGREEEGRRGGGQEGRRGGGEEVSTWRLFLACAVCICYRYLLCVKKFIYHIFLF